VNRPLLYREAGLFLRLEKLDNFSFLRAIVRLWDESPIDMLAAFFHFPAYNPEKCKKKD